MDDCSQDDSKQQWHESGHGAGEESALMAFHLIPGCRGQFSCMGWKERSQIWCVSAQPARDTCWAVKRRLPNGMVKLRIQHKSGRLPCTLLIHCSYTLQSSSGSFLVLRSELQLFHQLDSVKQGQVNMHHHNIGELLTFILWWLPFVWYFFQDVLTWSREHGLELHTTNNTH